MHMLLKLRNRSHLIFVYFSHCHSDIEKNSTAPQHIEIETFLQTGLETILDFAVSSVIAPNWNVYFQFSNQLSSSSWPSSTWLRDCGEVIIIVSFEHQSLKGGTRVKINSNKYATILVEKKDNMQENHTDNINLGDHCMMKIFVSAAAGSHRGRPRPKDWSNSYGLSIISYIFAS